MRIAWISGRNLNLDLAATTEIGLAEALVKSGAKVTLFSPGFFPQGDFDHIEIKKFDFPGLNSISGSRYIARKLRREKEILERHDVILVDWRYVRTLRGFLRWSKIPWMIIDRGPPAFKGPLNWLQKFFWSAGWNFASKNASGGFVVSKKHEDFVKGLNEVDLPIHVVPAGTTPNPYLEKKLPTSETLRIAYVGRLDERRGVRKILDFSDKMIRADVNHVITLCGEGDMGSEIEDFSAKREELVYSGKISREEVQETLAKCHVGIMPMPEEPIWRISSPLKFTEYLASGLAIIGPEHRGNDLGEVGAWNHLEGSDEWDYLAVNRISQMQYDWNEIEESALSLSREFYWDSIASRMLQFIRNEV